MINQKGFTLIELLVVVAIIGVLAAVGVLAFNGFIERSKDTVLKKNHDLVLKFLMTKAMECDVGNQSISFKDASGNENVTYSCSSTDKTDFANKLLVHVNNNVCKNVYRADRECMVITGGYIEETIAVDINTGHSSCAIYVRTYPVQSLNPEIWSSGYGGKVFNMPSWC
ncbi:MAG: hypothetical protein CMD90_00070 [Gammaproteobacteria bacterium]|nr:hypothetical protein [Gammaproteobacteria bacterium]|tara:strand:- start:201 stop:707 length:507 start_codon:yes stop_codon:yes gene_type:complete